jgi:putative heme-binding domain-containing protein
LLAIVDPNQNVEENFRLWTARTKDGRVISGRLEAETKGTFEIADLAGGKHVLVRGEVVSCEPSPVSLMPVGYEGLGVAGLADLLAFLARSR